VSTPTSLDLPPGTRRIAVETGRGTFAGRRVLAVDMRGQYQTPASSPARPSCTAAPRWHR
jgi:hypothetical protein